jgi:hypothetical protein
MENDQKEERSGSSKAWAQRQQGAATEVRQGGAIGSEQESSSGSMGPIQRGEGEARAGEKTYVVYALTTIRGRVRYVGQTCNLKRRLQWHRAKIKWSFKVKIVQDSFIDESPAEAESRWIRYYSAKGADLLNSTLVRKPSPKTRKVVRWVLCSEPGKDPGGWNIFKVDIGQSVRDSLIAHLCSPSETTVHGVYWSRYEGFHDKKAAMRKHDPTGHQYR